MPAQRVFYLLLFVCLIALSCSSEPKTQGPQAAKAPPAAALSLPADPLPVSASVYERTEPLITARITTQAVDGDFAVRTFRDPKNPSNYHQLVIGTGPNAERVYSYFHYLPTSTVRTAARDRQMLRWGLLFGKYATLAGMNPQSLRSDVALFNETRNAADSFYAPLEMPGHFDEGADVRGLHLLLRTRGPRAVIIGVTSRQWEAIRPRVMRGEKDRLYSLFPEP